MSPLSVIIPAHNEESVIERCLSSITSGAGEGELEIVVVCNGCTDATAAVARRTCPDATVLELGQAGKAGALNAGDRQATGFPRFYLDADIEVSIGALRAVADVLRQGEVLCAAPRADFDLRDRRWSVRSFYRVWNELPYLQGDMVGSGLYALSESGRARFEEFPAITADDQFVMQLFTGSERRSVKQESFRVHPPRTLQGLYRMRRRVHRGNRELESSGLTVEQGGGRPWSALQRLARQPTWWPALAVYLAVNVVSDLAGRRDSDVRWERDDSARLDVGAVGGERRAQVGYVTSRYPSISHTFVLREVRGVRRAGVDVTTFSVRQAEAGDLLSDVDREEAATTVALRPMTVQRLASAHLRLLVTHPCIWWSVLNEAVRDAVPGTLGPVWQVFYFAQAGVLFAECRKRGIRHLHAHMANVAADVAWRCTALGRRMEPHEPWCWSFTMHGPTELFDAQLYNLEAKVMAADLVICISDFARSQLMALATPESWAKLSVVHMGVDLDRYRPVERSGRSGPLRLLSVGRLAPVKGQAVLLEAVALLTGRGHDVSLTIVGDGPQAEPLRSQIDRLKLGDRCLLPGAIGQDELPALYAEADVFCMASFAEGVPVVLMEAMATGLPVVATAINGIRELVEDGRTGFLVAPGRADALADAIERLADGDLRSRFGQAGVEQVRENFDAAACAAQVADELRTVEVGAGD